jgi:hypothetical protein
VFQPAEVKRYNKDRSSRSASNVAEYPVRCGFLRLRKYLVDMAKVTFKVGRVPLPNPPPSVCAPVHPLLWVQYGEGKAVVGSPAHPVRTQPRRNVEKNVKKKN